MGLLSRLFGGEDRRQISGTERTLDHSYSTSTSTTAKDPVCGMDVDVDRAATSSEYQGLTYYFCSSSCKKEFDKNPDQYVTGQDQGGHSHQHGCCC